MLGVAKLAFQPRSAGREVVATRPYGDVRRARGGWELVRDEKMRLFIERSAWPAFASLSWASVMWLFWWHPDVLQPSLRSSMNYM